MDTTREGGLLAWQLRGYPRAHADRRNLAVHALTVPVFMAGTGAILLAPFLGTWLVAVGLPAMLIPVAAQGRGHRLEADPPAPFHGPSDLAARLFVEQWITFPRFVLGGGFARAWRAAAPRHRSATASIQEAPRH
jgi:hypothetical protein